MERRFLIFFGCMLLIWGSWIGLQAYMAAFNPPPAKKAAKDAVAKVEGGEKAAEKEAPAEERQAEAPAPVVAEQPVIGAAPLVEAKRERLTLGSADPASGYSALYYFDSRGAAVECVELNGPQYKSVEDHSGYPGRLALSDPPAGGAEVNLVGPGTPAALATAKGNIAPGLAVGDVIEKIDGVPVKNSLTVEDYLAQKKRPGQTVTLSVIRKSESIDFTAILARRPLEVVKPESHSYKMPNGAVKVLPVDPLSLLLTLENIGGQAIKAGQEEIIGLPSLYNSNWTVEQTGADFIEFSFTLDQSALAAAKIDKGGPLKIVKKYSVSKGQKSGDVLYHLNLEVSVHNLGEQSLGVAYRLNGPTGLPLEGWWYSTKLSPTWAGAGARDVVWKQQGKGLSHQLLGNPAIVSNAKKAAKKDEPPQSDLHLGDKGGSLDYAGVDTQFFASVIQPQPTAQDEPIRFMSAFATPVQDVTPIPKTRLRTADVSVQLNTARTTIEAGGELKHDYKIFFGPKHPDLLSRYDLDQLIEYGWSIFGTPAKLLRWVLNRLYDATWLIGIPNYGIAIILLTVIVRTCMIPVSLKQARSAAKMQELAPEIQKIKDKFPDDPMKQHQAVQELYKKHDFNMFGGCLPVFIQLPIFIGLYRCLSVDIDLRDAALIPGIAWASNLAGPDQLFYWKDWVWPIIGDEADGWLGPFFNVFPLITVTLFLVQQKMFTPPATDEQTKMQQQMMMFMTIWMGVLFYKVPAGLCIYFITSSLWGIAERKLLPKPKPKEAGGTDSGGGGLFAKLTTKPASPNGSGRSTGKRPKQRR